MLLGVFGNEAGRPQLVGDGRLQKQGMPQMQRNRREAMNRDRLLQVADYAAACLGLAYMVTVLLTGRGRLPMVGGHGFASSGRWWK